MEWNGYDIKCQPKWCNPKNSDTISELHFALYAQLLEHALSDLGSHNCCNSTSSYSAVQHSVTASEEPPKRSSIDPWQICFIFYPTTLLQLVVDPQTTVIRLLSWTPLIKHYARWSIRVVKWVKAMRTNDSFKRWPTSVTSLDRANAPKGKLMQKHAMKKFFSQRRNQSCVSS